MEDIRYSRNKASEKLGKVWSIGQRLSKNVWDIRMKLFDYLIKGIIMYGAEIWVIKRYEEIERIQKKYIKWVRGSDENTPDYIVMTKAKRSSISIDAMKRKMSYESKASKQENKDIRKICYELNKKKERWEEEEINRARKVIDRIKREKEQKDLSKEKKIADKRKNLEKIGMSIKMYYEIIEQEDFNPIIIEDRMKEIEWDF